MAKFRKKPVEVEAYQLTDELLNSMVLDKVEVPGLKLHDRRYHPAKREVYSAIVTCVTIHGQTTKVAVGDWVITEPDGVHHYPCKPDIFAATYDPA